MGNKAIRAVRECGIAELRRLLDEVLLFFYLIFSLVNLEPKKLCFEFTWGLFTHTSCQVHDVQNVIYMYMYVHVCVHTYIHVVPTYR